METALASSPALQDEFRDGFPFLGGRLWIDLLNTVVAEGDGSRDLIEQAERLAAWLVAAGLAPEPVKQDGEAEHRLRTLREALRPAIDLIRQGQPLPESLLARINDLLNEVASRTRLTVLGGQARLISWLDPGAAGPAGLVAADFARFVCEAEPERLKPCANPACSLVFYDSGKNNARRWCAMSLCGNRDKVARYRARRQGALSG